MITMTTTKTLEWERVDLDPEGNGNHYAATSDRGGDGVTYAWYEIDWSATPGRYGWRATYVQTRYGEEVDGGETFGYYQNPASAQAACEDHYSRALGLAL